MNRIYRFVFTALIVSASHQLFAQPWNFSQAINVSEPAVKGVFHHLESSGRRNIAVSDNVVAVAWEDDSDGTPRIYMSTKTKDGKQFSRKVKISTEGEAYEPTIIALANDRFAVAWEEDEQVLVKIISAGNQGPVVRLGNKTSAQVSLASHGDDLLLVYREQTQRFGQIVLHKLSVKDQSQLVPAKHCFVDTAPLKNDQLYPVIALVEDSINVVWEDRRLGHTVMMHSQSVLKEFCRFSNPVRISEEPPGVNYEYGAGHGVARVSLAPYGKSDLLAAWADKRDFQEGYDIYGAYKHGEQAFGKNVRIQDDFGENYRQWHTATSGLENGQLVVAWTDERDGTKDVWHSWQEDGEWSDDNVISAASGKGIQYHPSITLDNDGNLHAVWIHRDVDGGPTQIRYAFGLSESNN